jgi:hypothetical protein
MGTVLNTKNSFQMSPQSFKWRAKTEAEVENEDARKESKQEHDCAHTKEKGEENDDDIPGTTERSIYMKKPLYYISSIVGSK